MIACRLLYIWPIFADTHAQMAQYLIQHGADIFAVDIDGCMPCEDVNGDPKIARLSEDMKENISNEASQPWK